MNEKNEQDIFKDLIDSIHVEDDVDSAKRESAQRSDLPQKEGQAQAGITPSASSPNVSDPHVVPVRRTDGVDEELPHWLTEKKRPVSESGSLRTAAPGGETRAANGNPPVGRLPRKDQRPLRQEDKPRQAVPEFPTEKRKAGRRKGSR